MVTEYHMSVPAWGGLFYVKNALTHETYFLFQAVDLKPKHYLCFLKTAEFTTDESALDFEKQQQIF